MRRPRGPLQLTPAGEPLYGDRDVPELDKIRALGLPFWLAGGYGRPGKLAEALALGAAGIQVGTPFAFCEESGIASEIKEQILAKSRSGEARVFTDPVASPTGFPFKVAQLGHTLSDADVTRLAPASATSATCATFTASRTAQSAIAAPPNRLRISSKKAAPRIRRMGANAFATVCRRRSV